MAKQVKDIWNVVEREVYVRHADMCKVFSHPKRLAVINILRDGEMGVSELAKRLNAAIGNLSQHLNMMKQRQILTTRKVGNAVYYRLAYPEMLKAVDILKEILFEQIRSNGLLMDRLERQRARKR